MKGASFARQGEAGDLELVPTWVTAWGRNFQPPHKTIFLQQKSPKAEVSEGFGSCWADLNRRPHPYQATPELFSNYFCRFMAISTPNCLLSATLRAQGFRLFRRPLWLVVWSKRWGSKFSGFDRLHKCGQIAVFCATAVMNRPAFGELPGRYFCDGVNNDKRCRKHFDPHRSTALCPLLHQKAACNIHSN